MTQKRVTLSQIPNPGRRRLLILLASLFVASSGFGQSTLGVQKKIIFFGDSLTAGYGLDPNEAYPALIQQKILEASLPWQVINAGVSGETTTGGLRRLDWILRQPINVFVLALGANDGLRGVPTTASRANLQSMIDRIRAKDPTIKIVLAGMILPPNYGAEYTQQFAAMFPDLAQANQTGLIPFLLDGVGGVPTLNQADGIHPNRAGHQIVAETVWRVIKPLL